MPGLRARTTRRPFNPAAINGCRGWWAADRIGPAYAEAAAVDTWLDLSGWNHTMAQATGSLQPTFRGNLQAGRPAVRFDGGDGLFSTAAVWANEFSGVVGVTMISVSKITTLSGRQATMSLAPSAGGNSYKQQEIVPNDAASVEFNLHDSGSNGATPLIGPTPDTNFHVRVTAADGQGVAVARLDGVAGAEVSTLGLGTVTINQASLGYYRPGSGSNFLIGEIAEALIYNRTLKTLEVQAIERYLGVKYGITVVAG